jgi:hypothetical protein
MRRSNPRNGRIYRAPALPPVLGLAHETQAPRLMRELIPDSVAHLHSLLLSQRNGDPLPAFRAARCRPCMLCHSRRNYRGCASRLELLPIHWRSNR